ncbi:MAG: NUDIX domain-containing protein [Candidatus Iainarchaeum archaeon]|uniref:NUDIX domain-containing protein n=1 Tax=Candidatus Iainarchaeum sp. TaxID=3101447 RepID=A0A7T9DIV5_9ARCH|nr:MAG: NUDIX domain-containing protein [Candidatus Diapherotrites archaeon]
MHSHSTSHEEPIDWIDVHGKRILTLNKQMVHLFGLKHYAVHVFVINAKGELVLQRRRDDRFLQPGSWDTSVGGHVTSGESLLASARRETKEELRITSPLHALGQLDVIDKQKNYHNDERVAYYWCRTTQIPYYQRSEIAGLQAIPLGKVNAFIRSHQCSPMLVAGWKKFGKRFMERML